MTKMNFISSQVAFEYCMYMMLGSYFGSTKCLAPLQEKKLKLQYHLQKAESQYQMENICLKLIEEDLLSQLPMNRDELDMKVQLIGHPITGHTEIRLQHPNYILRVMCEYKGKKNSTIKYEIWMKEDRVRRYRQELCAA